MSCSPMRSRTGAHGRPVFAACRRRSAACSIWEVTRSTMAVARGTMPTMRSTQRDDGPNSVLGRAVSLLSAFRPDDDRCVSLSELARRAGVAKPTAHRLAGQLVDLGLLEFGDGGLRLGLSVFELGQLVPRQRGLRDAARPYLE